MKEALYIVMGLLLAMGGVGGVEISQDWSTLSCAVAVSIMGLVMMWCGVSVINQKSSQDPYYNMNRFESRYQNNRKNH